MRPVFPLFGLVVALMGSGVSGYLTVQHGRAESPLCGIGQGCHIVAQSAYAHLGSIPIAAFGLLMYLFLALLYAVRLFSPPPEGVQRVFRVAALAVALGGTGVSAWLTYVELYVLRAVCLWCVLSAALITLLLAVAATDMLWRRGPAPAALNR